MSRRRAPLLLTDCTWHGTLAAARDVGSRGPHVTLACDQALSAARWSRHVKRTVRCPPASSGDAFAGWLHDFARREPGHVYVPTSDDAAWVAAVHRDSLSPGLLLDTPPVAALAAVLDKHELARRARAVGLDTPETWSPLDEGEVERLSGQLRYPVIVKPRMHVLASGWARTAWAREPAELLRAWKTIRAENRTTSLVRDRVPLAEVPVIQAGRASTERILTVDGYIDVSGAGFVAMACTKILQCPRGTGPGLVFEDSPLDPALADRVRALLHAAGFHGIFDAEFIVDGGRPHLIDLNPRLYNHVAFEVDRGLPLPWLAYLAAAGETDELRRELEHAARATPARSLDRVYAFRMRARFLLLGQMVAGHMDAEERRAWRELLALRGSRLTDPVSVAGDRMPAVAEVLYQLRRAASYPRSSLRDLLRGSPVGRTGERRALAHPERGPAPAQPEL